MRVATLVMALLSVWFPAAAQQAVRIPLPLEGNRTLMMPAQLCLPAKMPAPSVARVENVYPPSVVSPL